jgi:actin-related protein
VSASISSIKDAEVRKKFLSNVLIIGGGGLLPQLSE